MAKYTKQERATAMAQLGLDLGDAVLRKDADGTVHPVVRTDVRHVARSGMTRYIRAYVITRDGGIRNVSHKVAMILGWGYNDSHAAVTVSGAGMDMGFHLVYSLSAAIYGRETDGTNGGYLLRQEWM